MGKLRELDNSMKAAIIVIGTMIIVAILAAVAFAEFGGFAVVEAIAGGLLLTVVMSSVVMVTMAVLIAALGWDE